MICSNVRCRTQVPRAKPLTEIKHMPVIVVCQIVQVKIIIIIMLIIIMLIIE